MTEETTETTETGETTQESLLDDSSVELGDGEWFLGDGIKGAGDKPDYYLSDKYGSLAEQAKGYSELQKKFGSFTGTPKDGYKMPEGIESDDGLAKAYVEFAQKSNMNQEGFDEGFELLSAQAGVNAEINQEAELQKLGDNADQRIKNIESALKFKLGDDYTKVKDLVTNADSIMLAESLIKAYAPQKLPIDGGENPTGVTKAEIELLSQEKTQDGQLRRSVDREFDKKITRMWTELLGDGPNLVTIG